MIEELLFPARCPCCRDIVPFGTLIHEECKPRMLLIAGSTCLRCGRMLAGEGEYCRSCREKKRSFLGGIAGFDYGEGAVREMLMRVKYHNERQLLDYPCKLFAAAQARTVEGFACDCLVPVPLHRSRRRKRGFNQAEEMAKRFAQVWQLPVETRLLTREGKTQPQKELDAASRLANLFGAFTADAARASRLHIRRVLLVDDICTTGSTLEACTQALKKAGVAEVYTAVLSAVGDSAGEEAGKLRLREVRNP